MKRRILSIITALALCLSLCPTWALAAEANPSLCKHHQSHTAECGYTAPTEGQPCGHQHTAECYTLGVLPDADSGNLYEVGGDTENLLDCHHSHDSECGYVQADPGAPCGYVCRICPIENLIAALPEQVTEDNAEEVRAQLDEILALYRELDEDEQGQIDLSRCYEVQGALDNANAPMAADGRTEQQDTNEASVTINGETLYYATLEEAFAAANRQTATITLLDNVTAGNMLNLTGGDVTLNCGGHTLSINSVGYAIEVAGGSLTVENGTVETPGGTATIGILDTADLLIVKETATIIVSKTFADGIDMPVGNGNGSTVKFYGKIRGEIQGGISCIGIYPAKGTLEVYPGAEISCNGGTNYCGIYRGDETSTVKLYGGTFSSDKGNAIDTETL